MPEPNDFIDKIVITFNIAEKAYVSLERQIKGAAVHNIVTIENGNIKIIDGYDPKQDPWFLIRCINDYNAVFYIISDGAKWHVYDNTNNIIVPRELIRKPPKSLKYEKISTLDQDLIQTAIANYIYDGVVKYDNSHDDKMP